MSDLNTDQQKALETLEGQGNVFLTGAAGSGKSYLLRNFLRNRDRKTFPVLASTGAAAILVGGRTFHSYFGLGIMEGGVDATVERALGNKRVVKRLQKTVGVVIDEVSMLSGKVLRAAEMIARKARNNHTPWGGIRVIAVGDFAQLPPVNLYGTGKDWAFLDEVWTRSSFTPIVLNRIMRSADPMFLEVLNQIRDGVTNPLVNIFLKDRMLTPPDDFDGTRLLARRDDVERYNLKRLKEIDSQERTFETVYSGKDSEVEKFKKHSPIPDSIVLKEGALVMLRQNDPEGRWINGSLGHITQMSDYLLRIRLIRNNESEGGSTTESKGREVQVEPTEFTLLDADGKPVVTARNFPVTLAWAVTIHKAQGTTLDKMWVDLRNLWEPGQAYVAVSRVRQPENLYVEGWSPSSIKTDPEVARFHQQLRGMTSQ